MRSLHDRERRGAERDGDEQQREADQPALVAGRHDVLEQHARDDRGDEREQAHREPEHEQAGRVAPAVTEREAQQVAAVERPCGERSVERVRPRRERALPTARSTRARVPACGSTIS